MTVHHDPTSSSTLPPLPDDRCAALAAWRQVHRDNAYLRRVIHGMQRRGCKRDEAPFAFRAAPRHAKLEHRPIILGLAPSIWARSHVAWDDPSGDQLAARLGMGGLFHLMSCFKLRNLFSCPLQDLPLEHQSTPKKLAALDKMVAGGTFKDRVVIVCGNEIRAVAALPCGRDDIGPVAHQIGGSSLVISMVEPGKSKRWSSQEGKREALQAAVLALLAARLPSATPVADAMRLVGGHEVESWRSIGGCSPGDLAALMGQPPREIWHYLVGLGIAAPPDLGLGAWYRLDPQTHEMLLTGGRITVNFDPGLRASGGEYVYGALLDTGGKRVFEVWSGKPHVVRTRCLDEAVRRGWEFPFTSLDRRLSLLRGKS